MKIIKLIEATEGKNIVFTTSESVTEKICDIATQYLHSSGYDISLVDRSGSLMMLWDGDWALEPVLINRLEKALTDAVNAIERERIEQETKRVNRLAELNRKLGLTRSEENPGTTYV